MKIYFPDEETVSIDLWTADEWRELPDDQRPAGAFVMNGRYVKVELISKIQEVHDVLTEWVNKKGHDRCHYYPDIFLKICQILNIETNPADHQLPPRAEFHEYCERFEEEQYDQI